VYERAYAHPFFQYGLAGGLALWGAVLSGFTHRWADTEITSALIGAVGGGLFGYFAGDAKRWQPLTEGSSRGFLPQDLIRPLAVGGGLVLLLAGVGLLGTQTSALPYYTLAALIGLIGVAGGSLRLLPLRLHQIMGVMQVGLVGGVTIIASLSLFTLILDGWVYSPAYLVAYTRSHNLLESMGYAAGCAVLGGIGVILPLEAFGYDLFRNRERRWPVILFATLLFSLGLVVVLPLWIIFWILPLGVGLEAWLLCLITCAVLSTVIWAVRTQTARVDQMLGAAQNAQRRINFLPNNLSSLLAVLLRTKSSELKNILTWEQGVFLVIAGTLFAMPLALAWPLWVIGVGLLVMLTIMIRW
jgi:hypothetical protein